MAKLPPEILRDAAPAAADGFKAMRDAIMKAGPLDAQTRELVIVGACATAGLETGTKLHAAKLLEMGVPKQAIQQAVLLTFSVTAILWNVSQALLWIDEAEDMVRK
jgi:alkylhydroperoxidase/carboxymuconolactone decarboxylase family protein YurZ